MTTKLIRGKIVADSTRTRRSEPAALSSPEERAVEGKEKVSEEEEINPFRDGNTFATETAPWVGAEQAWRRSILPPAHEEWVNYPKHADGASAEGHTEMKTPLLTDEEIAAVLTSIPPPAEAEAPKSAVLPQLLKYAAVAAFTAVSAWAVFGGLSETTSSEPEALTVGAPVADARMSPPSENRPEIPAEPEWIEPAALCEPTEPTEQPEGARTMVFMESPEPPSVSKRETGKRWIPRTEKSRTAVAPPDASPAIAATSEIPVSESAPTPADMTSPEVAETTEPTAQPIAGPNEKEAAAAPEDGESNDTMALIDRALDPESKFSKSNPYETETSFSKTNPYGPSASVVEPEPTQKSSSAAIPREEIDRVMSGIAPHVARCGGGENDRIVLEVWVSGATGRVTEAFVADKAHANTAVGICASKAVRLAKFPKFSGERLTVKYPFVL